MRDATLEDLASIVEIYNSIIPSRIVSADTEPGSSRSYLARCFSGRTTMTGQ
jgi:L-amino acid N-acyltransferase YncA